MAHDPGKRPATLWPPPLVYMAGLVVSWWMDRRYPFGFGASDLSRGLGYALIAMGLMMMIWSALTIWRHRTTINPYKAVSNLVTSGPFAFSRNPIYVGDWLVYAGVTLLLKTYWTLPLAPIVWWVMRYQVIAHEEAHLMVKFGQPYQDYMNRVRRWI
jgi:protein-S-isoprenylcysteine O-methyltransferase Ste14